MYIWVTGGFTPSSIDGWEECQSIMLVAAGLKCLLVLFIVSSGLLTLEVQICPSYLFLEVAESGIVLVSNESSFKLSFCRGIVWSKVYAKPVVEEQSGFLDFPFLKFVDFCFNEFSYDEKAFFSDFTLFLHDMLDSDRIDHQLPPHVNFPLSFSHSISFFRDLIWEICISASVLYWSINSWFQKFFFFSKANFFQFMHCSISKLWSFSSSHHMYSWISASCFEDLKSSLLSFFVNIWISRSFCSSILIFSCISFNWFLNFFTWFVFNSFSLLNLWFASLRLLISSW